MRRPLTRRGRWLRIGSPLAVASGLAAALLAAPAAAAPGPPASAAQPLFYFLQQCLNALQISGFYALLAVAYVLMYATANRINLAFGAIAMWAGYLTIGCAAVLLLTTPWAVPVVILFSFAYAVAGTAVLGYAIQHVVIRRLLRQRSLAILIATVGLAIVLEELVRIANAGRERWLQPLLSRPIRLAGSADFSVEITAMRLLAIVLAFGAVAGLLVFVRRHDFGKRWRAVSQDPAMAALCGIDVDRVLALTFVLASGYAAASGAVVALYYGNVTFYMGAMLGLKALLVAVVGGLTSLGGGVAAACLLGFLESLWAAYFPLNYRDLFVLAVLTLLLVSRPNGLFTVATRVDQPRH